MPITHTRRRFLATMTLAGLIRPPPATAGEGPLETTSVRLSNSRVICIAPQYLAEDLLRAEGFTDIRYVDNPRPGSPEATARGELDFSLNTAWDLLTNIDRGTDHAAGWRDGGLLRTVRERRHPRHHRSERKERRRASCGADPARAPNPAGCFCRARPR